MPSASCLLAAPPCNLANGSFCPLPAVSGTWSRPALPSGSPTSERGAVRLTAQSAAAPGGSPELLLQATAYAMIGGRAAAAGIVIKLGNHGFRATVIIAYLENG